MTTSSSVLRQASEIVSTYIKLSPYYVGRCYDNLDHEITSPDIFIPAAESEVNKLKTLIEDAQENSINLMQHMSDVCRNSY